MSRSLGKSVVAAASMILLLVLAGCSTPPPVGHTEAELQEFVTQSMDNYWGASPELDVPMPEVDVEHYLDASDTTTMRDCFRDEGMVVIEDGSGGLSWSSSGDAQQQRYRAAQMSCMMRFPVYPPQQGFLTEEQHDYLYDYFQGVLIPCLELKGYEVEKAPSREEFGNLAGSDAGWNPYSFMKFPSDPREGQELLTMCPYSPFNPPVGE